MLEIQNYLVPYRTSEEALTALELEFGIKSRRHGLWQNLVLFKYNQLESPMGERIVQECRGIILDEAEGWKVRGRAFDKFFNHGEGHAANVDWGTAKIQEKVDGSLMLVYPFMGRWEVATTGMPDADGPVHGVDKGWTFANYFWGTVAAQGIELPEASGEHCFYFELTGPYNRVVVVHEEPRLTLLGGRDLRTQEELTPGEAGELFPREVARVREFGLGSVEEVVASFEKLSPLSQEGYVVVDKEFRRIKVKHPGYVALHHAKEGMSLKAFVDIVRSGETSEVLAAFPEFKGMFEKVQEKYLGFVKEVERDWERLKGIGERKVFAFEANRTRCPAALFQLYTGRVNGVKEFAAGITVDKAIEWFGVKDSIIHREK